MGMLPASLIYASLAARQAMANKTRIDEKKKAEYEERKAKQLDIMRNKIASIIAAAIEDGKLSITASFKDAKDVIGDMTNELEDMGYKCHTILDNNLGISWDPAASETKKEPKP